jgi:hypothetical protein
MSGPADPSAGRAVNANHSPFGEYAADWPTRMTSSAIWTAPSGDADGVTVTVGDASGDGEAEPGTPGVGEADEATGDALGVGVGLAPTGFEGAAGADGCVVAVATGVLVGAALWVGLADGVVEARGVGVGEGVVDSPGDGLASGSGSIVTTATDASWLTPARFTTMSCWPSREPNTVWGRSVRVTGWSSTGADASHGSLPSGHTERTSACRRV